MRRIIAIALAALAAGCSLLSDVDDLSFGAGDGGDTDADSDTDVDTDTDGDTDTDTDTDDQQGTCDFPKDVGSLPYYVYDTTTGKADEFSNLCQSSCCGGNGETVYLFSTPYEGTYTVEALPSLALGALQVGVMEAVCGDGEWCVNSGSTYDSTSPTVVEFYALTTSVYYIVVEGIYGDGDYDLNIYGNEVVEDGTCEHPYLVGTLPWEGYGDTTVQDDTFGSICGSSCCPGGDAVFAFETPASGNYTITLTNSSSAGGGGFSVAVLVACEDGLSCHADGTGAPSLGDWFQLGFEAGEFTTYFIVVQGMTADGGGTFTLNVEAGTTSFDGGVDGI